MSVDWGYANVGVWNVENPRWFRRVLRTVGLIGEGDIGVLGWDVLSARLPLDVEGSERASLGRVARAASIVTTGGARYMLKK